MSAGMELHVALSMRLDAIEAYRLANNYRAQVLNEGADRLDRIANETEAKVEAHYGPGLGIGPGSAELVRVAGSTLRSMAAERATSAPTAPDFFQPGRTYRSGGWLFRAVAIDNHPHTGGLHAIGWALDARTDRWTAASLNAVDWQHSDWAEDTSTTTTGKDGRS